MTHDDLTKAQEEFLTESITMAEFRRMDTFKFGFVTYESSPKYLKMIETLKFYASLKEIGFPYEVESIDVSLKASALLKEIGEG